MIMTHVKIQLITTERQLLKILKWIPSAINDATLLFSQKCDTLACLVVNYIADQGRFSFIGCAETRSTLNRTRQYYGRRGEELHPRGDKFRHPAL